MAKHRSLALITLAAGLLHGCGEKEPGVYALPLAEAFVRLEKADIDGFRKARQCGILIHFAAENAGENAIAWQVTSSRLPVARFTVTLTAEGAGTRAAIAVPPSPKGGGEIYDGDEFYPRPALNQPLRPAVQELIDAAMEQRPYDVWRIPEPRNTDKVCSIQRAGLESGHIRFRADDIPGLDAEDTARARAEEDRERERQMRDFGKPMIKP